ncbi:uncharacterized protein LOC102804977 [Saccoglossus kowalevskii]|uniref:Tripartite motif-containing protein 40-like n=1 Tax=Saccoglossus kowalevskii TaxID=10224 RepID=A0ABM0MKQ4_SACKO|nr:PREDICTED: tripartite motif-containing protein 40-like [Saccoglossus kowalevskii]
MPSVVGGYELESFVSDDVKDVYICPVCTNVLKLAVQANCGHRMCATCCENLLVCPICNDTVINTIADYAVHREINAMKTYCNHRDEGCEFIAPLKLMARHLETCEYAKHLIADNLNARCAEKMVSRHDTGNHSIESQFAKLESQIESLSDDLKTARNENVNAKRKFQLTLATQNDKLVALEYTLKILEKNNTTTSGKIEIQIAERDVILNEIRHRIECLETTSYEGVLLWKICNYTTRKHEAVSRKNYSYV